MLLPSHCRAKPNTFYYFSPEYNRLDLVRNRGTTYELGLSYMQLAAVWLKTCAVFADVKLDCKWRTKFKKRKEKLYKWRSSNQGIGSNGRANE